MPYLCTYLPALRVAAQAQVEEGCKPVTTPRHTETEDAASSSSSQSSIDADLERPFAATSYKQFK